MRTVHAVRSDTENDWNRRGFLKGSAAALAAWSLTRSQHAWAAVDYDGLDTDRYLGEAEVLTEIEDEKVFTEGPAVGPDGNLYFTNVPVSKILLWNPAARELSVFRDETNQTNGLYFDRQGRLLCCEGGAGRVTRQDLGTGKIEVIADRYRGKPFAPPNDICTDRKGRIYFTSRPGPKDPAEGNVNSVYRVDPDGTVEQILHWPDVHMPNGIVVSPDDKTLYLIEAHPDSEHHRDIRAYDLNADGTVSKERVLIDFYPGRSGDGMCIDKAGRLYVAAGLHALRNTSETLATRPGIHVIGPDGQLLAFRETPVDTVTNCALDGDQRNLYITCGTKLVRMSVPQN